jgi:hypothetical protein
LRAALARARASSRLLVGGLLVLVLVVAASLRLDASADRTSPPSADQLAYLRLASDLRHRGTYGDPGMRQPFHWAPGTPALLAAADVVSGGSRHGVDAAAGRRAEAIVGTLTVLAAFALAALVAGGWAGLAAATAVALYPPAIETSKTLLSEPLGALGLTAALACLAWAWKHGTIECFTLAGLALGIACLARADLLAAALVLPLGVAILWRTPGRRWAGPARATAMLAAAALAIVPWSLYAGSHAGHGVLVTDGSAGTLFIGTYLPGHGTLFGTKHALAHRVRVAHPQLRHTPAGKIRAAVVLNSVAAGYAERGREAALRAAVRHNLRTYALGRPFGFAGMELSKTWRMWGNAYAPTHRAAPWVVPLLHRLLVALALVGLVAALAITRRPLLALVLLALVMTTAIDVAFVAEPRHGFRLLPALLAAGAAGWALLQPSIRRSWGRRSG